jgi:hypothetical protein
MPLRARPFFWWLFAVACIAVLVFAALVRRDVPAMMQVHLDQPHPTAYGITTLTVQLTDPQGLPIEQALIVSHADMTNMVMGVDQRAVRDVGQGRYRVQLQLDMAGPWAIKITSHAPGFAPLQRTLFVQVT